MYLLRYISVLIIILFFSDSLKSQTIDFTDYGSKGVNLSNEDYIDIIRLAVIDQPDFKALIARKAVFNFEYRGEKSERFPSITSSLRNDRILDRNVEDTSSIRKRQDDSTDFIVELSQPLYSGGIINKRIDNARKQKEIGGLQLKKQASDLVIKANEIFLDLIRYFILKNTVENALFEINEILENVEIRTQSGFANITEKALVQIRLNDLLIEKAKIDARLVQSKETFRRFFNKEFEVFYLPEILLYNLAFTDIRSKGILDNKKSYDYQISEISYKQEKNNLSIAKGDYLPKLGFNIKYIQYDFDEDFTENDIRGGVTFKMPIFDFGRTKNKVSASRSKVNEYKWNMMTEKRNFQIMKSEIENRIISVSQSIFEIKSTIESTRNQKRILIDRNQLSEFNGINLSEIIMQETTNISTLLDTEISLYLDDLLLSQIKTELLNRFRLEL